MGLIKKIKTLFFLNKKNIYFESSKKYWQDRYMSNGTSGSGSYGNLALFKAEIINDFVNKNNVKTVIDFGCGDGNQLRLAKYDNYIGVDVSIKAVELCESKFKMDSTKKFYIYNEFRTIDCQADLVLSLDVIFHLLEDDVFDSYMSNLFSRSKKYVIIYSSNYDQYVGKHVRCRKFTDWIDKRMKYKFEQIGFIKNIYPFDENQPDDTSMSDFFIYKKID
jgi:cyclopropane fatty-acyl-phospholipid synthase-like methyltransferase